MLANIQYIQPQKGEEESQLQTRNHLTPVCLQALY